MRQQAMGAGLVSPTQGALPPFRLVRPRTLEEAKAALGRWPHATLAAGCTDLVAGFREGCSPSTLISLQKIDELRTLELRDGWLRIGAMLTHDDGSQHPEILRILPELGDAWSRIATVRIRFRATVGGNLIARRFRYEMPVILGALDTRMEFSGPDGDSACTVDEFVTGDSDAGTGAVLLRHLAIETESLRSFVYDRSLRPLTTVALASRYRGGCLRLTAAVGSEYRRTFALRGESAAESIEAMSPTERADAARHMASQLPDWIGDYAGSARYRRRIVEVLLRRCISGASENEGTHT